MIKKFEKLAISNTFDFFILFIFLVANFILFSNFDLNNFIYF